MNTELYLLEQSKKRQPEVSVVSSTARYRQLAKTLPVADDTILEIGCSFGQTTEILASNCSRIVAVDVSNEAIARTHSLLADKKNVHIEKIDGRDIAELAAVIADPSLIFIDIGGNAQLDNVAFVLRQCIRAFQARSIVIKSLELSTLTFLITEIEPLDTTRLYPITSKNFLGCKLDCLLDLSKSLRLKNRMYAVKKLVSFDDPKARERLKEMENDPSIRVRQLLSAS